MEFDDSWIKLRQNISRPQTDGLEFKISSRCLQDSSIFTQSAPPCNASRLPVKGSFSASPRHELWCVEDEAGSMFLWNPSMQTYRKLPNPLLSSPRYRNEFSYGLGYDSVDGDYKMVKLRKTGEAEMYSLRSNSWREIPHRAHRLDLNFSRFIIAIINMPVETYERRAFREYHLKMGVFVDGALHWMAVPAMGNVLDSLSQVKLISFDLSTEKYGELELPPEMDRDRGCQVEMTVLKGMLCLCVNYYWGCQSFVLWIMEDYGVVESWTKMLDIDCKSRYRWLGPSPTLRPFYFDDNGEILINVCGFGVYLNKFLGNDIEEKDNTSKILVCKVNEQTLAEKDFRGCSRPICDSFVYVESLVLLEKRA